MVSRPIPNIKYSLLLDRESAPEPLRSFCERCGIGHFLASYILRRSVHRSYDPRHKVSALIHPTTATMTNPWWGASYSVICVFDDLIAWLVCFEQVD